VRGEGEPGIGRAHGYTAENEPSTYVAELSFQHYRDPGTAALRACSSSQARRGHRRLVSATVSGRHERIGGKHGRRTPLDNPHLG